MLDRAKVLAIAKLSKLELTEEEVQMYQTQLGDILDFVKQLSEVDIADVQPTFQVTGLEAVLRKDEVREAQASFTQLLENSDLQKIAHQILVKKVL